MTYAQHDPDLEAAARAAPLRLSPEAWASCRRDYEEGVPAIVLAERYGIGDRHIRRRAADEGWKRTDLKARQVLACLDNDRAPPSPDHPRPSDESLAMVDETSRWETRRLLVRPNPEKLSRYAFRRATEQAARGAPHQCAAWLRVVNAIDRSAIRLEREARSPGHSEEVLAEFYDDLEEELKQLRNSNAHNDGGPDDADDGEHTQPLQP